MASPATRLTPGTVPGVEALGTAVNSRHGIASFLAVAGLALLTGCAPRTASPGSTPRPPTSAASAVSSADALKRELTATFDSPSMPALWAVKVQSLDTGEVLFEREAHRLVMPASNMKIVTMAVAAERLGWDFTFPTTLETDAPVEGGTLAGDLIVVGHGDPSISSRDGDPMRVFEAWADRLRELGITRIAGRILGDDGAFDDRALGDGWAWDYLAEGYAAMPGALQFNENAVTLTAETSGEPGTPAAVSVAPGGSGLELVANVQIAPPTASPDVNVWRYPFSNRLEVTGRVPKTGRTYTRTLAVDNPTQFFVTALKATLTRKGITVDGEAVDADALGPVSAAPAIPPAETKRRVLFTHQSPPLSALGVPFMKVSQNLFGETFLNAVGVRAGLEPCEAGATMATCRGRAAAAAKKAYEQVLTSWGVPANEFIVADGSGLSRYNYVTADSLVTILRRMAREPRHRASFEATLPVMGKDGSLQRRMKGTRAEGNVRAKTGTIANVRSLSGYLTTAGGESLAFSIVANNFKGSSAAIDAIAEQAVERLVNFKR